MPHIRVSKTMNSKFKDINNKQNSAENVACAIPASSAKKQNSTKPPQKSNR